MNVIENGHRNGPIIAELAGPSGAGKSTISALLNESDKGVTAGLTVWKIPRLSLVASGIASIPDITRLVAERRRFDEHELKQVVRMRAFGRRLQRSMEFKSSAVFLDEGVVFALAKLRADIGAANMSRSMRRWEEKMLERWSQILDLVIWIDAPNQVLLDRIRTRPKRHRMKDEPAERVYSFLENYRDAYRFVLSELQSRGKTRVLQIGSGETEPAEIAGVILNYRRSGFTR